MNPVILAASRYFRVSVEDILGRRRNMAIVKPRAAVAIVLRHRDELSFPIIGRLIGGRDHSTAINLVDSGWGWMIRDETFGRFVDALLCAPKFCRDAIEPESPFGATYEQPPERVRGRHLGPCPSHLVRLNQAPKMEVIKVRGGKSFRMDENGDCPDERFSFRHVAAGSKALLAAMRREHPERFAT